MLAYFVFGTDGSRVSCFGFRPAYRWTRFAKRSGNRWIQLSDTGCYCPPPRNQNHQMVRRYLAARSSWTAVCKQQTWSSATFFAPTHLPLQDLALTFDGPVWPPIWPHLQVSLCGWLGEFRGRLCWSPRWKSPWGDWKNREISLGNFNRFESNHFGVKHGLRMYICICICIYICMCVCMCIYIYIGMS